MKKGSIYIVFSLIVFVLSACGPNKAAQEKKQEEDLAKEVIAIHDEVMPKMGELAKMRKQLKDKVNTWTETDAEGNAENIQKATNLINDLEGADKAMMDWMHEYNGGQGLYEHDLVMEYLNVEKGKITAVQKRMQTAMDLAKAYLETNAEPLPITEEVKK